MAEFPDKVINPLFSASYGLPAQTELIGPPIQGTILTNLPGQKGGPILAYSGPWPPPEDKGGKAAPAPAGTSTAPPEGAHKTAEYRVVSLAPSVELTNNQPVPYGITATANHDTLYSPDVNYRGTAAMRLSSRITTNTGDEPANGRKGVVSGAQGGMAAPITASKIVRINGSQAIRHGDRFEMNKPSIDGPGNTIGEGRLVRDPAPRPPPPDERSWWQWTKDGLKSAAKDVGDFDAAHGHALTRGLGAVQAVGGGIEAVGGVVGGVLTAETGVGALTGAAVAVNGADNFQSGLRTLWTGEGTRTVTQTAVGSGIKAAGGSETTQAIGEAIAGLGPGGVRSVAALPGRLARIGRVAEDAPTVARSAETAPAIAKATEDAGSPASIIAKAEEAGEPGLREQKFHQQNTRVLHMPDQYSFRNDPALSRLFDSYRKSYWQTRSQDFE